MSRELVKRIDMAIHVQELCAKHDIKVRYQSLKDDVPKYYANQKNRTICIRPTKNTGYYVSALHELGHILGSNQTVDNDILEREIGAWKYAMVNAIVWTDTATRVMKKALMSYGVTQGQWQGVWSDCLSYYNQVNKNVRGNDQEEVA